MLLKLINLYNSIAKPNKKIPILIDSGKISNENYLKIVEQEQEIKEWVIPHHIMKEILEKNVD